MKIKTMFALLMMTLIFSCTSRNLPDGIASDPSSASSASSTPVSTSGDSGWSYVGKSCETEMGVRLPKLFIENQTLYASYVDYSQDNAITVKKFDGSEWKTLGSAGFANRGNVVNNPSNLFVSDGIPYVGFIDNAYNGRFSVMELKDGQWQYLGTPGFSVEPVYEMTPIYVENDIVYAAFFRNENTIRRISVMKYDKKNNPQWVFVGNPDFSLKGEGLVYFSVYQGVVSLVYLSEPSEGFRIYFVQNKNGTWENISDYKTSVPNAVYIEKGVPYLLFPSFPTGGIVQKYENSEWKTIGTNPIAVDKIYSSSLFVADGIPYASFEEGYHNQLSVVKLAGDQWTYLGKRMGASRESVSSPSLFVYQGVPVVAYEDYTCNEKLSVSIEGQSFIDKFRRLTPPVFSLKSGLYQNTQTLTLTAEEGTVIRYTTDGTFPTRQNGVVYQEPVIVKNTMKVRAFPPLYHPL